MHCRVIIAVMVVGLVLVTATQPASAHEPAVLKDFAVPVGTLIEGDLEDIIESDDREMLIESQDGFVLFEAELLELVVGATNVVDAPEVVRVEVESRATGPVIVKIKLRNWETDEFDEVGVFGLGHDVREISTGDIDATPYIRDDGRIEASVKYVAVSFVTVFFGFESGIDQVSVLVN